MRHALAAMWSALIRIFSGVEKFAAAFEHVGEVAENSAKDLRDEEVFNSAKRRAEWEAEYGDIMAKLEKEKEKQPA